MRPANKLGTLLAIALAALLVYGVYRLPFVHGNLDVAFPDYSSFRNDPMGMRAFYEALKKFSRLTVVRNTRPLRLLKTGGEEVLILAGCQVFGDINEVERDLIEIFEQVAHEGGRVVIAFYPYLERPNGEERDVEKPTVETSNPGPAEPSPSQSNPEEEKDRVEDPSTDSSEKIEPPSEAGEFVNLGARWGVCCEWGDRLSIKDKPPGIATLAENALPSLPKSLAWYSCIEFSLLTPEWHPLYVRNGKPVLIERSFGQGSIVLSGDSYFLSNEGIWRERAVSLLAWLIGDKNTVIFDEYLKGVSDTPGIMMLVRSYRLYGVLAGIALVVLLWIWQAAVPLVPRYSEKQEKETVARHVARREETLVALLRRSIPERDILRTCVMEWKQDFKLPDLEGFLGDEGHLVVADKRGIVEQYNNIVTKWSVSLWARKGRPPLMQAGEKKTIREAWGTVTASLFQDRSERKK